MIKVIKHGTVSTEKEIACCQCGCIFTYSSEDTSCDRDGRYVVCPDCNAFLAI